MWSACAWWHKCLGRAWCTCAKCGLIKKPGLVPGFFYDVSDQQAAKPNAADNGLANALSPTVIMTSWVHDLAGWWLFNSGLGQARGGEMAVLPIITWVQDHCNVVLVQPAQTGGAGHTQSQLKARLRG